MSHIDGGTILITILLISLIGTAYSFGGAWRQLFHRDNSPLQKAKRDWCKAWNGTFEKQQAEKEWDELGIAEFNKAATLSELCSACERVFWYSHRGKYKKRESEVLLKAHKDKKEALKEELREKEREEAIRRAEQSQKLKEEGRRHAPPPKKLPNAGKNFHFHSGH